MIKKNTFFGLILIILIAVSPAIYAQFRAQGNYIGPSIGLSFLGSSPELGINYEHGLKLEDIGTIGIGGVFRYWSYSENYLDGKWSYTNILIGAQGNYHFKLQGSKFDPWLGLILAYDAGSVSWSGNGAEGSTPVSGGFWSALEGGTRYWISPTIALTARLGLGTLSYTALDVGVDFKF